MENEGRSGHGRHRGEAGAAVTGAQGADRRPPRCVHRLVDKRVWDTRGALHGPLTGMFTLHRGHRSNTSPNTSPHLSPHTSPQRKSPYVRTIFTSTTDGHRPMRLPEMADAPGDAEAKRDEIMSMRVPRRPSCGRTADRLVRRLRDNTTRVKLSPQPTLIPSTRNMRTDAPFRTIAFRHAGRTRHADPLPAFNRTPPSLFGRKSTRCCRDLDRVDSCNLPHSSGFRRMAADMAETAP